MVASLADFEKLWASLGESGNSGTSGDSWRVWANLGEPVRVWTILCKSSLGKFWRIQEIVSESRRVFGESGRESGRVWSLLVESNRNYASLDEPG